MPNRKMHKVLSKFLVGDSCDSTHKIIDYPVRFLGKNHRRLFHDPITASIIGYATNRERGVVSALSHILADFSSTYIKKQIRNNLKNKS